MSKIDELENTVVWLENQNKEKEREITHLQNRDLLINAKYDNLDRRSSGFSRRSFYVLVVLVIGQICLWIWR